MKVFKMMAVKQREFQKAFGRPGKVTPSLLSQKDSVFRDHLMREEVSEYLEGAVMQEDLELVLDSLVDQLYVLLGTINEHGLQNVIDEAFEEVHRSNMAKLWEDGNFRNDANGKTMKPPTWTAPDLKSILEKHLSPSDDQDNQAG